MIPEQPFEVPRRRHRTAFDAFDPSGHVRCHWLGIPTVDEVDDVLSPMKADAVLQILKGEGIYYGLGAEQEPTPDQDSINARRGRRQAIGKHFAATFARMSKGGGYDPR
jgi:hypothetical protein